VSAATWRTTQWRVEVGAYRLVIDSSSDDFFYWTIFSGDGAASELEISGSARTLAEAQAAANAAAATLDPASRIAALRERAAALLAEADAAERAP
jgi:hypothetical protein